MNPEILFQRYQELQSYVGWTEEDVRRVQSILPLVRPSFAALVDDFYAEIQKHPEALKVITGGPAQINRLKGTLTQWLTDLLTGPYDQDYVTRRWKAGARHVEIGLDQVYANVALARLRIGLLNTLTNSWQGSAEEHLAIRRSLNTLLDLDLAIIEDAYQAVHLARQQRIERLAAIGQVSGGVAHELRNPLNVIKTSIYFLLNARNVTPQKTTEHLHRIERNVVLADSVITALSNFTRLPMPSMKPFAVQTCIQEALEGIPWPTSIPIQWAIPAEFPLALADIDQVRIVFSNLLRNARDAMSEGGKLSILGREVKDHVEVDIMDNGVGIAPEDLNRIMEPLYSTKARGLGLGLAIARAILEKNRGSLRVTSKVEHGSTFTVQLLAAPQERSNAHANLSTENSGGR